MNSESIEQSNNRADVNETLANADFIEGRFAAATRAYEALLDQHPGRLDIVARLGHLDLLANHSDSAVARLSQVLEHGMRTRSILSHLAEAYCRRADLGHAALCYQQLGQAMAAYSMYKRLTYDFPESKWAAYARGRLSQDAMSRLETELEIKRLEEMELAMGPDALSGEGGGASGDNRNRAGRSGRSREGGEPGQGELAASEKSPRKNNLDEMTIRRTERPLGTPRSIGGRPGSQAGRRGRRR